MKKYLLIFFSSIIVYLIAVPLRAINVAAVGLLGGFILYFSFTLLFLYKYDGKVNRAGIFLSIFLGCIILELPIRILHFHDTLGSLPDTLFKVMAIVIAYVIYSVKSRSYKIAISALASILVIWLPFNGFDKWWHKMNFGTFSGHTEQMLPEHFIFQNAVGENVSIKTFRGQYVVLDFWNSACGWCFEAFPDIQKLVDKYKDNDFVSVFPLHCRRENKDETFATGQNTMAEYGYAIPTYSMDIKDPVLKDVLGVKSFPTVLIIDPDGKIIFRGSLEYATKYLEKLVNY